MMKLKIGASELELLQFFAGSPEATGRAACDHFAATKSWQRSTVLKTISRLMDKGALVRTEKDGVFRYSSSKPEEELRSQLVKQFMTNSLNGSLFPLISYFDGKADISDEEISALKDLVKRLEEKSNG